MPVAELVPILHSLQVLQLPPTAQWLHNRLTNGWQSFYATKPDTRPPAWGKAPANMTLSAGTVAGMDGGRLCDLDRRRLTLIHRRPVTVPS